MASISSNSSIFLSQKSLISNRLISRARYPNHGSISLEPFHKNLLPIAHSASDFNLPLSEKVFMQRNFSSRKTGLSLVPSSSKSSGTGEDDHQALETVLKLYTAIKDRNLGELSSLIGDEYRCVCNFITFLHSFHGKKQVLEFFSMFSFLMKLMGGRIEFVVQPTLHEGMNVEVRLKLAPDYIQIPLGKGISFHLDHIYNGKVLIRNIEMFMEPILHIEPLRLKIIGLVMSTSDRICSCIEEHKGKKKKAIYILFSLALGLVLFFLLKQWF